MERDNRMTDAAATPPDSGQTLRGDCFQLWKDDAAAICALPEAERHELTDAILTWFHSGELRKPSNMMLDWFLSQLVRKQETAAREFARRREAQAAGGRDAMRRRWHGADKSLISHGKSLISHGKSPCNENENENENKNKNENETRSDAPPPFCFPDDSLTPPQLLADVGAMIDDAARTLGDCHPSRDKWRAFIQRNGGDAFRDAVKSVAEDMRNGKRIDRPGAYLNSRLDAYTPPPPPAPPPPPIEYGPRDWILCAERCRHYDAGPCKCSRGIDTPPEHDRPPRPPEECHAFARRDG